MHADALRRKGLFDEVLAAFWKEDPNICRALDLVRSKDVFIIPFFISNGYFTEQILPRELGTEGEVTMRGHRRIFYGQPVGTHPSMTRVLLHCAQKVIRQNGPLKPDHRKTTLIVVGHGTTKQEHSAEAVRQQVNLLRQQRQFHQVLPAFMEQEPYDRDVLARVETPYVIVLPFFISDGLHSQEDVPANMGLVRKGLPWKNPVILPRGKHNIHLWYARAVGRESSMTGVILDRVHELERLTANSQSHCVEARSIAPIRNGDTMNRAPKKNIHMASFMAEIRTAGKAEFGGLLLRCRNARFSICHVADQDVPVANLKKLKHLKEADELGRTTVEGNYRPLRSAPTLRRGWIFRNLSGESLIRMIDCLLPGAVIHRAMWCDSTLRIRSFEEAAARQTGIYASVRSLSATRVRSVADRCCGKKGCVKHPLWSVGKSDATPVIVKPGHRESLAIPCPEPCSWMIEATRRYCQGKTNHPYAATSGE